MNHISLKSSCFDPKSYDRIVVNNYISKVLFALECGLCRKAPRKVEG